MASYRFEKLSPRILLHSGAIEPSLTQAAGSTFVDEVAQPFVDTVSQQVDHSALEVATPNHGHGPPNGDMAHPDDPVRGGEHQALLDLVPHHQATHRAVSDGVWTAPATWESGQVPDDGAHVLISEGVTVEVDGEIDARLATIRVDGVLNFATNVDTSLTVDTFVVAVDGTLNIGTSAQPIAPDVTAGVLFTDDGPIDTTWDPTLLSRGLISHGNVSIYGAAKSGPINLAAAPEAGDTELQLSSPATGWNVGDRVLVPGVVRPAENNKGKTLIDEDEIVVIAGISADGRQITINQPLEHDHVPPRAELTLPVANLDRNVQFSSENTTDPQRAGHVMFMHSPDAAVNYAAFRHIGRNDKSIVTTDPQLDDDGNLVSGTGANARGRYAVHFHRIGSENAPALVIGSVVENNPGWGFVNHDSNVIFASNVSYNVKGAGFVSEIGTERGAFIGNLAVRSRGKNFYQPLAGSDKDEAEGFGSTGHGFWLQSSGVALIGNVAAGHAQEGIFINNRTVVEPGRDLPSYASLTDVLKGTPLEFAPDSLEPEVRDSLIRPDQAPLAEISGNKVFASGAGIAVRWRRATSARAEGDEGDVIEDFEIWNVKWAGVHLGYVSGLTLRNGLILGDVDDPISLSNKEKNNRETETREIHAAVGKGIAANRNSKDLTYKNVEVGGFTVGIQALSQNQTTIDSVQLQNIENLVVVTPQSTSQSDGIRRIDATNVTNVPLSPSALGNSNPYNVRLIKQLDRAPVAGGSSAPLEWEAFIASDEIYYNGQRLFFYDQAADAVPFAASEVPNFMNQVAYQQYVGLTNQELLDQFGLALGAEVAPSEATDAFADQGIAALALDLDEAPTVPERVHFRFNYTQAPTTWTLNDADLAFSWTSKGLPIDTQWRVYLNGHDGTQEIARSGIPTGNHAEIVAGSISDDWQTWDLQWPVVGQLPDWWEGNVLPGDYSLIAVAGEGPAVYLGQISVASAPAPTMIAGAMMNTLAQVDLTGDDLTGDEVSVNFDRDPDVWLPSVPITLDAIDEAYAANEPTPSEAGLLASSFETSSELEIEIQAQLVDKLHEHVLASEASDDD